VVSLTYDPETKALYIQLIDDAKPVETISMGIPGHYMDISASGEWIGLEILFPSSTSQEAIDKIIKSDVIKLLAH
jgi:uncharacterized protein YuzE